MPQKDSFNAFDSAHPKHTQMDDLVPIAQPFVTIDAATKYVHTTQISARVHVQRDAEKGRAWKEDEEQHGAVYTYEAIEADQVFQAIVQIAAENEAAAKELLGMLNATSEPKFRLSLGRSRATRYGGEADYQFLGHRSRECFPKTPPEPSENLIYALLTSPCILRNSTTGQYDPTVIAEAFSTLNPERITRFVRTETAAGFNRKWGLELPQAPAIAAGSLLKIKLNGATTAETLLALEHEGIGERKIEGFGRLVFLSPGAPQFTVSIWTPPPSVQQPVSTPPAKAREMQKRLIMNAALPRLHARAYQVAEGAKHVPSNSLLGRLRLRVRNDVTPIVPQSQKTEESVSQCLLRTADNKTVSLKRFLEDVQSNATALDYFNLNALENECRLLTKEAFDEALQSQISKLRQYFLTALFTNLQRPRDPEEAS